MKKITLVQVKRTGTDAVLESDIIGREVSREEAKEIAKHMVGWLSRFKKVPYAMCNFQGDGSWYSATAYPDYVVSLIIQETTSIERFKNVHQFAARTPEEVQPLPVRMTPLPPLRIDISDISGGWSPGPATFLVNTGEGEPYVGGSGGSADGLVHENTPNSNAEEAVPEIGLAF